MNDAERGVSRDTLKGLLGGIDRFENEVWLRAQAPRKVEEAEFHDHSHQLDCDADNTKFYSVSDASREYLHGWLARHAPGSVVLDYACGNGELAIAAAKAGAHLSVGIDISRESIANARALAREGGVEHNTCFIVTDCERTGLPDGFADVGICSGMLHHLDLSYALPELRRVIKPGGPVIVDESLNYNPVIKLYRRFTPHLRTAFEVEHILSHRDVRFASHFFEIRDVRYWYLATLLAVPFRRLPFFGKLKAALSFLDRFLLKIPGLRLWAWQFTFVMVKRGGDS